MSKAVAVRVAKHRNKARPRHGVTIEDLNEEEKEWQMEDNGEDIQVKRVFIADMPQALSIEVLKEMAEQDRVYQKIRETVKTGRKPKD